MTFPIQDKYCRIWRNILSSVAGWEDSRIDEWITNMLPDMTSENSLTFHELPSTWVAWALFPLDDSRTIDASQKARNEFCRLANSLHGGRELSEDVDWHTIRPAYEKLAAEIAIVRNKGTSG